MIAGRDGACACQRRLHVADVLLLREPARDVPDGGPESRILDGELVALQEHDLFDGPHPGVVQRDLGPVRLARELIDLGDVRRADRGAGGEDDEDERQPAPDRLLAVPTAPDRHAGGKVALRGRGAHA